MMLNFHLEDAGRVKFHFMKEWWMQLLVQVLELLIYQILWDIDYQKELGAMVKELSDFANDRAIISVHNHNDLGLATAKYFSKAVLNGARQIEVTINGLGERAGNSALEEAVMAIKTRKKMHLVIYIQH